MKTLALFFLSTLLFLSCAKDESPNSNCSGATPTYTGEIADIFNASCAYAGCHGGSFPADGLDLSTYAKAKATSLNGKVLVSVKQQGGAKAMPLGAPKLSDAIITKIDCWIQNGAPE
ncbi:MAG: hypothetical protein LW630_04020 [Saprospiraceae bacterium]|jgi:mono/diheme cytochrome c family protein|nr:hypothetical protein [Saprospiraceae bacterium]